ncbi:glutathione-regulated potassium-efflux system ATP-binding protein [Klebsiella michiganensis]|jgi:ATPase subunit of ABC transporter with duplicated ATPase domains|nr:glutathione-regulated potassium-efflux system ATP-binding protein [Klebsiella michiganensis]
MSTLLTAQSLHVDTAFGPLFTNLSFTLKKGDRIGLIGYNGCGKSTLLQVLDGTIVPSSGSVALASHCLMARVEQHLPDALLAQPLLQVVLAKLPALSVRVSAGKRRGYWQRWALRQMRPRSGRQP